MPPSGTAEQTYPAPATGRVRSPGGRAKKSAPAWGGRSEAVPGYAVAAHHAIIPTSARVQVGRFSREETLLYDLIRRHYLAQFFPLYEYDATVIHTRVQDEVFRVSGRVDRVLGWKEVLGSSKQNTQAASKPSPQGKKKTKGREQPQKLPSVEVGESAQVEKAEIQAKKTKPPQRYTEGTLIQAMKMVGKLVEDPRLRKILRDTSGIGTEATRASIIETLLRRELLAKEGKKHLISQPAGRALTDALPHSVTDPATTAVWEQTLDDIANRGGSLEEFLEKSELWLHKLIGNVKKRQAMGINPFQNLPAPPVVSKARKGRKRFSSKKSATRKPASRKTEKKPASRKSAVKKTAEKKFAASKPTREATSPMNAPPACPDCGQTMQRRTTARGSFWGCSSYPECSGTLADN
ncbi:MAG: topoisomerase DNA-binding C4 zinc finger domain-containing protein [Magnetococcales bacterium]|nr:topoisomerase DNA-binding C4 zinc finger domain-containing protein [Magnetococcales bacterium]